MKISAEIFSIQKRVDDKATKSCLTQLQLRLELIDSVLFQLTIRPPPKAYDLEQSLPVLDRYFIGAMTCEEYLKPRLSNEDVDLIAGCLLVRQSAIEMLYSGTKDFMYIRNY